MKKFYSICILALACISIIQAQEKKKFDIKISGFVRNDIVSDSRASATGLENQVVLFPLAVDLDLNGIDRNDYRTTTFAAIASRLQTNISGPEILGAKSSGFIEMDFASTATAASARLRVATIKLDWGKTQLISGQTWHPNFITSCVPTFLALSAGLPFQEFNRSPQIRLTHSIGDITLMGTVLGQQDYVSTGPTGKSNGYQRRGALPELNAQIHYTSEHFFAAVTGGYKSIKPRTTTTLGYATDETLSTSYAKVATKLTFDKLQLKASATYGGNMTDVVMLGGYAVSDIDITTGHEQYTSLNNLAAWGQIVYGKDFKAALLVGYSKTLGCDDPITGAIYATGANIDRLVRISPAIKYKVNSFELGLEIQNTTAWYGDINSTTGKVENIQDAVSNNRVLISTAYYF